MPYRHDVFSVPALAGPEGTTSSHVLRTIQFSRNEPRHRSASIQYEIPETSTRQRCARKRLRRQASRLPRGVHRATPTIKEVSSFEDLRARGIAEDSAFRRPRHPATDHLNHVKRGVNREAPTIKEASLYETAPGSWSPRTAPCDAHVSRRWAGYIARLNRDVNPATPHDKREFIRTLPSLLGLWTRQG
jgi:hypothetical protein